MLAASPARPSLATSTVPPMTTSSLPDRSPSDVSYTDEPSALARVAWPQVAVLFGIGIATLGPILLAILLAL